MIHISPVLYALKLLMCTLTHFMQKVWYYYSYFQIIFRCDLDILTTVSKLSPLEKQALAEATCCDLPAFSGTGLAAVLWALMRDEAGPCSCRAQAPLFTLVLLFDPSVLLERVFLSTGSLIPTLLDLRDKTARNQSSTLNKAVFLV